MSDQERTPTNGTSQRCAHEHAPGKFCARWPSPGSRYCYLHRAAHNPEADPGLALARLSSPADLFDVIREALHAVRFGRIHPGQAYAVAYLAQMWLRVYRQLACDDRAAALEGAVADLVAHDAESLAAAAATPVHPIPPLPDSPVVVAMEDGPTDSAAPFPLSLLPREDRLHSKHAKKRILAKFLDELGKPAPSNGTAKSGPAPPSK
ncbi:MAG: hypothetical protein M1453_04905 [Acidobacteria bacterium]|nr:hypothetical protein [Acidobacteriota bacterium]MCL5287321.1 hypothetical protein [Acidobacteriota bacterium]